jgi:putative ABC transport system permease protein
MLALMLGALRSRGAQTVTVLVLAVLAVSATAAAPWYVLAADATATHATVQGAPSAQRVVSAKRDLTVSSNAQSALDDLHATVRNGFDAPGVVSYLGLAQDGRYLAPGVDLTLPLAYRDQVCQHVILSGDCPRAAGEALVSRRLAGPIGVRVGDPIVLALGSGAKTTLRVVGLYDRADPTGVYWAEPRFAPSTSTGSSGRGDPVFVPASTFVPGGFDRPSGVADLVLPEDVLRHSDAVDRLNQAQYTLVRQGLDVTQSAGAVLQQINHQLRLIDVGVLVGVAQLLVLCWFALYLAGRSTGPDRRLDVSLLKLRGATFGRLLRLTVAHAATPILAGLPFGVLFGYLAARWLVGPLTEPGQTVSAWRWSAVAVLVAVFGAVLAIVAAEWRTLRSPTSELLRRVPPRRRGWRGDAVSLCVVALAAAGAYQVRAQGGVDGSTPGLAVLAPGLIALALAVLLARGLTSAASTAGAAALHTGRLRVALGALQVARRPGVDRVFVLLAVAIAVLGSAAGGWYSSTQARTIRARVEVGAERVLTVQAAGRAQLLDAVRAADPTGREAMAAVYTAPPLGGAPVLAVDSTRLASVASWQPGYGTDAATLAAALRTSGPDPLTVAGASVTLDATLRSGRDPIYLLATLSARKSGEEQQLVFGPLTATRQGYRVDSPSCVDGGCRLLSLRLVGARTPAGYPNAAPGTSVAVQSIVQSGPDKVVANSSTLADVRRWRGAFIANGGNPVVGTAGDQLTLTLPGDSAGNINDGQVYAVDAPLPLPIAMVGPAPQDWLADQPSLAPFGADQVPVRVAATPAALPVVGGRGVLVDLAAATAATGDGTVGDSQQVWLARGAPADLPDRLRAAGLTILGTDSIGADLTRSAAAGTTAALRFQLLTALVGLLLGAAALTVVGAAERGPRAAELAALRQQGMAAPVARAVGYGGYAALAGVAVLAGVLGAVFARLLAGPGLPVFAEPWTVLPIPIGLRTVPLLLVGAVALVLLGAVAAAAGAQVVRAIRTGTAR